MINNQYFFKVRNKIFIPAIASILVLSVIPLDSAFAVTEDAKLTASDGAAGDFFGFSVSMSGDKAVVGAQGDDDAGPDSGSAYVFEKDGGTWTQTAKLTASDDEAGDSFGVSVSISGDKAVVGAAFDDDAGPDSGSAYVFEKDGGTWTQTAKLTASDDEAGDSFGVSVSMSGDTAVVGALLDDDSGADSGSAYVFEKDGGTWTQTAKLTASDGAAGDFFGFSVSMSGDTAVVGALLDDDSGADSGSAYVFEKDGGTWTQTAKLTASDDAARDSFGDSVSISGDKAVVGARGDDDAGPDSGSAYVFEKDGGTWTQTAKLTASDGAGGDRFGSSVSISGDKAVVGAAFDNDAGSRSGSAYVFEFAPSVDPPIQQILDILEDIQADVASILGLLLNPNFGLEHIKEEVGNIESDVAIIETQVDEISTKVDDLISASTTFVDTETISLTGNLKKGDYKLLMDITPFESITGHVAMKVPCDKDGETDIAILAGVAPAVAPITMNFVEPLSDPGNSCLYHGDIGAGITDIALANTNDKNQVHFGPEEEGFSVTITIEGTEPS